MNSYSGYILNNFMNKYFIRVKIKNYLMNRYWGILNMMFVDLLVCLIVW